MYVEDVVGSEAGERWLDWDLAQEVGERVRVQNVLGLLHSDDQLPHVNLKRYCTSHFKFVQQIIEKS